MRFHHSGESSLLRVASSRLPAAVTASQLSGIKYTLSTNWHHLFSCSTAANMADRPQTATPRASSSPLKTTYLALYNFVSAILWSTVLGRVLVISAIHGTRMVYPGVGEFTKWTQTLACLEILHAAVGIVRAPLLTTAMQVASRLLLVWGVVNNFPNSTATSPVYSTMLVAWSVTEVIRYSFFAMNLSTGSVPKALMWLRYEKGISRPYRPDRLTG